ncbi:hypothetical protein D3C71_196920 [compost metagenome]
MKAPTTDQQALDAALNTFRRTLPRTIDADDIEHVFASFQYLAEPVVGVGLQRVVEFLRLERDNDPLDALAATAENPAEADDGDGEDEEEYRIQAGGNSYILSIAPRRQGGGTQVSLRDVTNEGDSLRIAGSTVWTDTDGDIHSKGFCRVENYSRFMDFMDGIRHAMEPYLRDMVSPFEPMKDGELRMSALMSISQQYLIDRDGKLPGRLCREAGKAIISGASATICDYIAATLPEIVASATARGIVWGQAFLEYNDLDNNVTAIPTEMPGRSALYHRNTSLIFDHNAFVVWTDHDSDGRLVELSAAALLPGDDRLRETVAAVASGEIPDDVVLMCYRPADRLFENESFFATGLMQSMAHYVSYDFEEIVDGRMDASDDAAIKTDFCDLFFGDDEFQNAP